MEPVYKRVLIKISGEALGGEAGRGLDFKIIDSICEALRKCVDMGVQVAVVVGGGNIWRGLKDGDGYLERTRADSMGMLATAINALAVSGALQKKGIAAEAMTAVDAGPAAIKYTRDEAVRKLESGCVVVLGCGTGNPFFSTDTAAVLRAAEIGADIILMAKNVDAVYTADPKKDPNAKRLDTVTYSQILADHLSVIDMTAAALAADVDIPIMLFGVSDAENICKAVTGLSSGTVIKA
ncbi:MAG: UMP kinase [Oscillospiraceae bacterium]|nr:UMP kinase [Oscillospiraceae bacterium]